MKELEEEKLNENEEVELIELSEEEENDTLGGRKTNYNATAKSTIKARVKYGSRVNLYLYDDNVPASFSGFYIHQGREYVSMFNCQPADGLVIITLKRSVVQELRSGKEKEISLVVNYMDCSNKMQEVNVKITM